MTNDVDLTQSNNSDLSITFRKARDFYVKY